MSTTFHLNLDRDSETFDLIQRESCGAETRRYVLISGLTKSVAKELCSATISTSEIELKKMWEQHELEQTIESLKISNPELLLEAARSLQEGYK